MAKPIEPPPEWASDETNNTEPAALQKQTGWEFEQTGVSDYDNWWKRTAQKWIEYVDSNVIDGDLEIDGNLTVNDDLHVLGNVDFDGDLIVGDDITMGGEIYHANRTYSQGFEGGTTDGSALSFSAADGSTGGRCTIAAGDMVFVPCHAPIVNGVSRVKAVDLVFETTTMPTVFFVIKSSNPAAGFTLYGGAVTNTDTGIGVGNPYYRRKATVVGTPPTVGLNERLMLAVVNNAGGNLVCHELTLTYDAQP